MLGRENTGSALCSGAVDADFWALVCEDEEWLGAEFEAIVSEACETPTRSRRRFSTGTDPNARARRGRDHPVTPGRGGPGTGRAGAGGGNGVRPGEASAKARLSADPTDPFMTGDGERTVM